MSAPAPAAEVPAPTEELTPEDLSSYPLMKLIPAQVWYRRRPDGLGFDLSAALTKTAADDFLITIKKFGRRNERSSAEARLEDAPFIEDLCFGVFALDCAPGKPSVIVNPDGTYTWNTYVPPTLEPREGQWPSVRRVLMWLVNHEEGGLEWLINWLAYKVQNPGERPGCAVLLQGPQGTGKNVLFQIISEILGPENCAQIGEADVGKEFNGHWAFSLLVFMNELSQHGRRHVDLGNTLKAEITDQHGFFENKGKDRTRYHNRKAVIAATNHSKPIELESSDRRWTVFHNPDSPNEPAADGRIHREFLSGLFEDGPGDAFTPAFKEEIAAFAFHLLHYKVSGKYRVPYENEARETLKEQSEPPAVQFFRYLDELPAERERENRLQQLMRAAGCASPPRDGFKLEGLNAYPLEHLFKAFQKFCDESGIPRHCAGQSKTFTLALKHAKWTRLRGRGGVRGWQPPPPNPKKAR
jgi:hypothetical protein